MISAERFPLVWIAATLLLLLFGAVTLFWGRRLPKSGSWLAGGGLVLLGACLLLGGHTLISEGVLPRIWSRGWIWNRSEMGAVTVGVLADILGFVMALLVIGISLFHVFSSELRMKSIRLDRLLSAFALSCGGVSISCFGFTPWVGFIGLGIALLAGFLALSSPTPTDKESETVLQYSWQRSFGLIVAFLGACMVASSRHALILGDPGHWFEPGISSAKDLVAISLLIIGLWIQFQPFPFLEWLSASTELPVSAKLILTQVFPAWISMILLVRIYPQILGTGLFPYLGWFSLLSCIMATAMGLLESKWKLALGAWISAGFALAGAAFAFSGPTNALGLLIGTGIAGIVYASAAGISEARSSLLGKIIGVFGICCGIGLPGWVSGGRFLDLISQNADDVFVLPGVSAALFFFVLLGWKLAWNLLRREGSATASWSVLTCAVPLLLSLAAIWDGTMSGGFLFSTFDRISPSLLSLIFPNADRTGSENVLITILVGYFGLQLFAFVFSFWACRGKDRWAKFSSSFPRLSATVTQGYGTRILAQLVLDSATKAAVFFEEKVSRRFLGEWLPGLLAWELGTGSRFISRADQGLTSGLGRGLKQWVEAPAKAVQFIQNGDVQWYLFIAVGSAMAMLGHFLLR